MRNVCQEENKEPQQNQASQKRPLSKVAVATGQASYRRAWGRHSVEWHFSGIFFPFVWRSRPCLLCRLALVTLLCTLRRPSSHSFLEQRGLYDSREVRVTRRYATGEGTIAAHSVYAKPVWTRKQRTMKTLLYFFSLFCQVSHPQCFVFKSHPQPTIEIDGSSTAPMQPHPFASIPPLLYHRSKTIPRRWR